MSKVVFLHFNIFKSNTGKADQPPARSIVPRRGVRFFPRSSKYDVGIPWRLKQRQTKYRKHTYSNAVKSSNILLIYAGLFMLSNIHSTNSPHVCVHQSKRRKPTLHKNVFYRMFLCAIKGIGEKHGKTQNRCGNLFVASLWAMDWNYLRVHRHRQQPQ